MDRAHVVYGLRPRDKSFDDWFAGHVERQFMGSIEDVATALRPYADAGVDRVMIMHSLHADIGSVQLIGERLAPMLAR
jgi:hypothetical protein